MHSKHGINGSEYVNNNDNMATITTYSIEQYVHNSDLEVTLNTTRVSKAKVLFCTLHYLSIIVSLSLGYLFTFGVGTVF